MDDRTHKTPRNRPKGWRGVFASRRFWFLSAEWSAIAFVTAAGLLAIMMAYMTGSDGRLFGFAMRRSVNDAPPPEPPPIVVPVAEDMPRHPLDGAPLDDAADRDVFGVVIDNIGAARPHAGVSRAKLVYEAPVEGGITRLLAFFADDGGENVERIGPVRSARPYFQVWIDEFDAAYGHVGGSPEALERLKRSSTRDLNQYVFGAYYWRDRDRSAPHNVYTSIELLRRAADRLADDGDGPNGGTKDRFSTILSPAGDEGRDVTIDWSTPQYLVEWDYDPERNMYVRYQGGRRVEDEDGQVVRANNVVVHYTEVRVLDAVGRRAIDTTGPGRAVIARDGRIFEAEWSGANDGPAAYVADGDPVLLAPGVTWIEVVPEDTAVTY